MSQDKLLLKKFEASTLTVLSLLLLLAIWTPLAVAQDDDVEQSQAIVAFNEGQDAHEKGNFAEAVKLYDKALELEAEFPEAELQKAAAELSLGDVTAAETSLRRAIKLRPEWTLAQANLGSLLVGKGEYTEAEGLLTKAVATSDLNYPAYAALVDLRLKTNANPKVLGDLLLKIQDLTNNPRTPVSIWVARAALERSLQNVAAAKKSAAKALELDPNNQYALVELADAAITDNDISRAEAMLATLEFVYPNAANTKMLRAKLLVENGEGQKAIELLNSMANPPKEVLTLRDKIILITSANPVELEKQLESDENNATILGRLCKLYRVEAPARSLNYCRRAAAAEPKNIAHAVGFGAALVQARSFDEAVRLFRRIIELEPDNYTVHANLATALFQLKRYQEAKVEFRWLTEKQPKLAVAYYFLAISHDQLAEYLDAMINYQQFLKFATTEANGLEIEKVNLRIPILERQIKNKKGKKE